MRVKGRALVDHRSGRNTLVALDHNPKKHSADSGAAVGGGEISDYRLPTFSLREEGAKKKFTKRNAVKGISPSADGDESSALDSQTFGKV